MSVQSTPWPAALEGSASIAVIEQAIQRKRLSHSLLISGGDLNLLAAVANAIADRVLNTPASTAPFPPQTHPDCFALRPTKKSRQISADDTRELITKVQVSSAVSPNKVAIIHECDRMNLAAANIFLKTLEEPPAHTTLLLLTTRPYSLLPTIRSRCLHFRFPSKPAELEIDGWAAWRDDYRAWLGRLLKIVDRKEAGEVLLQAYGLIARFDAVLSYAAGEVWKKQKQNLPAELTSDEVEAYEVGISNGLRMHLFLEIEHATRDFALPYLEAEDDVLVRSFTQVLQRLERNIGLLRINLNESAVLEDFLLASIRLWARKS